MLKIHNTKFRHVWAGLVKDIMEAKLCWLIVSRCIILSKMSLSHKNGIIKIYERLIGPCGISLDYIGSNSALWSGLTLTGFAETTSWEGTSLHCREILPLRPIWQAPIKLWHGASLTQQLHLWFTNAYTQTHTHTVWWRTQITVVVLWWSNPRLSMVRLSLSLTRLARHN